MPFGRDTRVDPCNIVLDRGPGPLTRRVFFLGGGVGTPQFTAMSPTAKLLCPLLKTKKLTSFVVVFRWFLLLRRRRQLARGRDRRLLLE